MKRTLNSVFGLLFGSMFLYACETCDNPTITTPTQEDFSWLVYKMTSEVAFENEANALIESYKYIGFNQQTVPAKGVSLNDDCIEKLDTQVVTQIADTTKQYPALFTYILKRPDSLQVRVAVENRGDWLVDKDNPTYETLEVNGYLYYNVYEINPDSVRANSVKKILFNKDFGFLQVDFYDNRQLRLVR
ncbi:hypothetical protein WG947_08765 [Pontibacter sp. H259]|uniref:hypothetical protein n=1 Tax=Pontibacter sp. H259 TaxID=3133421 RepID=UPI0030C2077D